jgi:hypothetical protein
MSYYAHSIPKAFVGTKASQAYSIGVTAGVNNGLLIDEGVHSVHLKKTGAPYVLGVGSYGFFNPKTNLSVIDTSTEVAGGQALFLAASSVLPNDKIGKFHGGYAESTKSKLINPKFVSRFYKVEDAIPEQSIVHVGVTNFQLGTTVSITAGGTGYTDGVYTNVPTTGGGGNADFTLDITVVGGIITAAVENNIGTGAYIATDVLVPDPVTLGYTAGTPASITIDVYTVQDCEFEFLCGETYNLFINLHGAQVLRVLNHDAYRTLAAYTGCCPEGDITPSAVDSTLVMIDWATQITEDPYLKEFIMPVVFDEAGNPWFSTAAEAVANGSAATQIWDNYVSTGHVEGALAGIRLIGAYVDTQFSTCTFQCSDYHNKEVVHMDVSLLDTEGDPCTFNGICISQECCGYGGEGFGETYLRELIKADSYLQNKFSTDPRVREVTQGDEYFNAIDKTAFYTKYVIQHNVPRNYNSTGIHNADQYSLCIYVPAGITATELETFMETWMTAAGNALGADITANGVETFTHVACSPVVLPTVP